MKIIVLILLVVISTPAKPQEQSIDAIKQKNALIETYIDLIRTQTINSDYKQREKWFYRDLLIYASTANQMHKDWYTCSLSLSPKELLKCPLLE